MKKSILFLLLSLAPTISHAQDANLRSKAIALLERAHAASVAPNLPNLERVDTFQVFNPSAAAREGSFSRVVVQGVGRREETTFGDYYLVQVWTGETLSTTRTPQLVPPEVDRVMWLTPIRLVTFDESDVIRTITDRDIHNRPAHCIAFDTIVGEQHEQNELCVDAENGTLVSEKLGNDLIENSEFFPFAGILMPGHISYSVSGNRELSIIQTMISLAESAGNVLAAPPDAKVLRRCTTFRRAIGQSMPQPGSGSRGPDSDVVVRGVIERDGRVSNTLVQSSERPDLNAEALGLIGQWTFLPAMCNGDPNPTEASFVVHFHGR
jgi:Gram-negative bacterial TonB protein C-terminal